MCRGTLPGGIEQADNTGLVLERLQQRLQQQLNLNGGAGLCGADHMAHMAARGSGPRLFCGHVPPECSEELVKAHFSQWGHVMDVYFPKRKDTFRRRPFCFVTFNRLEDAQRALAESPMNICGIPIKQLNLVEDRADYYKHRHNAAQTALVQALQTLALLGNEGGAPGGAPMGAQQAQAVDLSNLAALLSLESTGSQLNAAAAARPQPFPMHQPVGGMGGMNAYADPMAQPMPQQRYNSGNLPFANLPGFSQAGLTTQAATGMAMPSAGPAYAHQAPPAQPAFPPSGAAALAAALGAANGGDCRLSGGDWQNGRMPGSASPYSTLEGHPSASSSPPKNEQLAAQLAATGMMPRHHSNAGSHSSGSASPDLDAAAANRLAMWQLQSELLAEGVASGDWQASASQALAMQAAAAAAN